MLDGLHVEHKHIMIVFALVSFMSSIDNILTRRSIRRYETKDIPQEVLQQILEAGRQAPSAANRQPIRFVIVKDHD